MRINIHGVNEHLRNFGNDTFGFNVERRSHGYSVKLPHECDRWTIADSDQTQAGAAKKLRRFIAEATAALASLETYGGES